MKSSPVKAKNAKNAINLPPTHYEEIQEPPEEQKEEDEDELGESPEMPTGVSMSGKYKDLGAFKSGEMVVVDKSKLEKAEIASINLCFEYHEFQIKEEVRGIYLGLAPYHCIDKQTGEEKELIGAVFVDYDGNPKINCASKFVGSVSKLEIKDAFSAECTRTKKTGNGGNLQLFNIRKLDYSQA